MKKLQLSIGVVSNARTWPLLNGTIEPAGIELIPTVYREPHVGLETIPNMGISSEEIYKYGPGSIVHRVSGGPDSFSRASLCMATLTFQRCP